MLFILSWNGEINMDGVSEFPLNFGGQVLIEVGAPHTRLRSFRFDNLRGLPAELPILDF